MLFRPALSLLAYIITAASVLNHIRRLWLHIINRDAALHFARLYIFLPLSLKIYVELRKRYDMLLVA